MLRRNVGSQVICSLSRPLVNTLDTLETLIIPELSLQLAPQISVAALLFITPATVPLVSTFQKLHVRCYDFACVLGHRFTKFVADEIAKTAFVNSHGVLVSANSCVEFRKQGAHFECGFVERTPYAAYVVDDVFEQGDGRLLLAVSEAHLDKAATDPYDGG